MTDKISALLAHLRAAAEIAEELHLMDGRVTISELLSCIAEDIEDPITTPEAEDRITPRQDEY